MAKIKAEKPPLFLHVYPATEGVMEQACASDPGWNTVTSPAACCWLCIHDKCRQVSNGSMVVHVSKAR